MNVRAMRILAKSLIRDGQAIDAHFLRWINLAYRELASLIICDRLNSGRQVSLTAVSGATNEFYLPYDFCRTIAFVDGSGRSMDPIRSADVRQFGEYNSFGSFAMFYEKSYSNNSPLLSSGSTPNTIGITNRGVAVTCSAAVFTQSHVGEWILPLARNTAAGAGDPEDYGYKILSTAGTTAVPTATCTLERGFRGVLSDSGVVGDLTTSYFEVRPRNTQIIKIWGDPGATSTLNLEYQRIPSKLANDEDIPEIPELSQAIVYKAIFLGGLAYRQGFVVKTAEGAIAQALAAFKSSDTFDKELVHNFQTSNPMNRGYSQISGGHLGQGTYQSGGIRY